LLENQKMGISQFAEQVNYQRGLEGELARSIQSLAVVKGAGVHLASPSKRLSCAMTRRCRPRCWSVWRPAAALESGAGCRHRQSGRLQRATT
jgi:flagellar M-ring protein FliF